MFKSAKISKIFALTLLSSVLLLSILSPNIASVKAQGQASVTILDSLGGSTNPVAGTTNYNDGTAVTLTAIPLEGYVFVNWQIITITGANVVSDNPATLTVSGGVTYAIQAIFDVVQTAPGGLPVTDYKSAAIVVVLAGAGGTTTPPPGIYALANASKLDLTAIPDSGWQFSHWVISGDLASIRGHAFTPTPTDNPYNVDHGYASQFNYQPVFIPTGSTEPTPTVPEFSSVSAIIIALILVAIAFGTYTYRRKTK